MTTMGDAWKQQLSSSGSVNNSDTGSLLAAIKKDEDKARLFFEQLLDAKLSSYIATAAENKQRSITLEVPGFVLGTDALMDFSNWANSQQLDARIAGILMEDNNLREWRLALLLRPE